MIPKVDLYNAVMNYKTEKLPEKSKEKSGRGRYKILESDPAANLFRVFGAEEGDGTGDGDQEGQEEFLSRQLKGLTKEEVCELREKIKEISKVILEDETQTKKIKKFCKKVKKVIEEKLEDSEEDENQLKEQVLKRINKVPFEKIATTLDATCQDLYKEYEKKVKSGKIIPRKQEKKGRAFAKAILRDHFS